MNYRGADLFLKCHTHPKIKDAPKRRRESSHTRALGAATMARPKVEPPMTPQMTPASSVNNTPATVNNGNGNGNGTVSSSSSSSSSNSQRKAISPLDGLAGMI